MAFFRISLSVIVLPIKTIKASELFYLDRLRDDDRREEGDEHGDDPLVGHVVAELEAVREDDEGAAKDGDDANQPAHDSTERRPPFVTP